MKSTAHRQSSKISWYILIFVGSIVLSFILYSNTLTHAFVYDDALHITNRFSISNPRRLVEVWSEPATYGEPETRNYRPVVSFTYELQMLLTGEDPLPFHVVSVVLHGVVVFLVYRLVLRLSRNTRLAGIVAVLFAVLPIQTESVAFAKARDTLLYTFFGLWSWLYFLKATEGGPLVHRRSIQWSTILFLLAFLSKELAVTLPFVMLSVWLVRKRPSIGDVSYAAVWLALAGGMYMLLRSLTFGVDAIATADASNYVINPLGYVSVVERFATSWKLLYLAIVRTVLPVSLSATYQYNAVPIIARIWDAYEAVLGVMFAVGLVVLIVSRRSRDTPLAIGALVFLIPAPLFMKLILPRAGEIFTEHWLYFPSLGLVMIIGSVVDAVMQRRRRLGVFVLVVLVGLYGMRTINRNQVWATEETLNRSMLADAPESMTGYLGMGIIHLEEGDLVAAGEMLHYADTIYHEHRQLLNALGGLALREGRVEDAHALFQEAYTLDPHDPQSIVNVGRAYYENGQYEEAAVQFRLLLAQLEQQGVPNPDLVLLYALALHKLERYQESIDAIKRYASNDLENEQLRLLLVGNHVQLGELDEAEQILGRPVVDE